MKMLVNPCINDMPDRAMIAAAAQRSARTDPLSPGVFTRNNMQFFQAIIETGEMYVGVYGDRSGGELFVPLTL